MQFQQDLQRLLKKIVAAEKCRTQTDRVPCRESISSLSHDPYISLSQQMQLVCSAVTKADELFLSGKLSESDALQARVLMGDLDIDVVRSLCANNNYITDSLRGRP